MKHMHRNGLFAAFMALILLVGSYEAQAQSDVENRIRRLENEIQTLGRAVFRGDVKQPPSSFTVDGAGSDNQAMVANLNVRLNQLEAQLRDLTGQIEQQNFKIRQMEERLQQVSVLAQQSQAQNQQQFVPQQQPQSFQPNAPYINNNSNNYMPPQGVTTPPAQNQNQNYIAQQMGQPHQLGSIRQNAEGEAVVNTQNPTYLYDTAFALLQQGEYDASAKALTQFLGSYADHPLAPNAQYWLGETYYVRNNFEGAAKSFATGYQKYPKSAKAPDNLLKLALSLSNLNKNEEACVTLTQLKSEYPKASSSILRKADEEKERLSCSNGD